MYKILIYSNWYSPAYRAGGPITSLINLVKLLDGKLDISIVTSAYDLDKDEILDNIIRDTWQKVNEIRIKYLTNSTSAAQEINYADYNIIYLNSMFSPSFTLKPLLYSRKKGLLNKVILAPRGMLQAGALKQKAFKKKIFLLLFRLTGIANKIRFHATDEQEKEDILKSFPNAKNIIVVPNVINKPFKYQKFQIKESGKIRLVYLSVISSKKNLKYLIEVFKEIKYEIEFEVYGSIKDKIYWKSFSQQLVKLKNVRFVYKGDVPNYKINETLSKYDFFVLPTLGENFGHAIFEALSSGTPVIISDKTPWRNLEEKKAGWDIPLNKLEKFIEVLNKCAAMDQAEYNEWSNGAFNYAKNYYDQHDYTNNYIAMFESGKSVPKEKGI